MTARNDHPRVLTGTACAFLAVPCLLLCVGTVSAADDISDFRSTEQRIRSVVDRVRSAVVDVGHGTGVIIREDGLVLTCWHVIDHLHEEQIPITVSGNRTVDATRLGYDSGRDLALLKIDGNDRWSAAPLGCSTAATPGEWCLSLGYPVHAESSRDPLLRIGRVLAVSPWWLAADSLFEGADCGGPLLNLEGEVIAINTGGTGSFRGSIHIPIDVYRQAAARLLRGDRYRDPWLDQLQLASAFGLLPVDGVDHAEVAVVIPGSAADAAGLQAGDVVLRADAVTLTQLSQILELASGRSGLQLTILRGRTEVDVTLEPGGERHRTAFDLQEETLNGHVWLNGHPEVEVYQRNSPVLRQVMGGAAADAWKRVVVIFIDGKRSGLGTIVRDDGLILTCGRRPGSIRECRLADGRRLPLHFVGRHSRHDLALFRVAAADLPSVKWRDEPIGVGVFVAVVQQSEDPLAYGVISTTSRSLRASLSDLFSWNDLRITSVSDSSSLKVRVGDRVTHVNGSMIPSDSEFIHVLRAHPPGDPLILHILRDQGSGSQQLEVSISPFGFPDVILHDAAISSRHLGGPVVDLDGRIVGINVGRCRGISTCMLESVVVREAINEILESEDAASVHCDGRPD